MGSADPCVSNFACHVTETMTFLEHSTRTLFPNGFDPKYPSPHVCLFSSKDLLSFRTPPTLQISLLTQYLKPGVEHMNYS